MSKGKIITAAACTLALGVLIVAMSFEPAKTKDPVDGDGLSLDDIDNPDALPGLTGRGASIDDPRRLRQPGSARDYAYASRNKKGQLVEFGGQTFDPLPSGESNVGGPIARIHLKDHVRVIEVRADHGRIRAPNNELRSGELTGHVVVTMFESPDGEAIDYDGAKHARWRAFAKQAYFDIELSRLHSSSDVQMTGQPFDIRGQGFNLIYDAAKKRLDRVEIARGDVLRFDSKPLRDKQAKADDQSKPKKTDKPKAKKVGKQEELQRYRVTLAKNIRIDMSGVRATGDQLELGVVLGDGGEGDDLFDGLSRRHQNDTQGATLWLCKVCQHAGSAPVSNHTLCKAKVWHPNRATTFDVSLQTFLYTAVIASNPNPADARSLYKRGLNEVVVRWDGPLVITPRDTPTQDKPTKAGLESIALRGAPVTFVTDKQETGRCQSFEYVEATELVTLTGAPTDPLLLHSPRYGKLIGRSLTLDRRTNKAHVVGPAGRVEILPDSGDSERQGTLTFSERLDVAFHRKPEVDKDEQDKPDNPFGDLFGPFKRIDVAGDVRLRHPSMNLDGDTLAVTFHPPRADGTPSKNDLPIKTVQADGRVVIHTPDTNGDGPMTVRSEHLEGSFTEATGDKPGGGKVRVWGKVDVLRSKERLRTGLAEITFESVERNAADAQPWITRLVRREPDAGPPLRFDQPARLALTWQHDAARPVGPLVAVVRDKPKWVDGSSSLSSRLKVTRLSAEAGVWLDSLDEDWHIWADRVVADAATEQATLYGNDERPAIFWRDDVLFIGNEIVVDQKRQTVFVPGKGKMAMITGKPKATAKDEASDKAADQPATRHRLTMQIPTELKRDVGRTLVVVAWQRQMRYDNLGNRAYFVGDVRTQTLGDRDVTELLAHKLELTLVDRDKPNDGASKTKSRSATELMDGGKDIAAAVASAEPSADGKGKPVSFVAENWADRPGGKLNTRFKLTGPIVSFDRFGATGREGVVVPGAGTMLVEDYRPEKLAKNGDNKKPATAATPAGKFTGRGATLFTWQRSMTIDAESNDVDFMGQVQMVHRTLDKKHLMQLDSKTLHADFQSTGGMAVWIEGSGPQPRFQKLQADGSGGALRITITSTDSAGRRRVREITSDHLNFDDATRTVTIEADPGRVSTLTEVGRPSGATATGFTWDLDRDRFEAKNVGVGRAPISRQD